MRTDWLGVSNERRGVMRLSELEERGDKAIPPRSETPALLRCTGPIDEDEDGATLRRGWTPPASDDLENVLRDGAESERRTLDRTAGALYEPREPDEPLATPRPTRAADEFDRLLREPMDEERDELPRAGAERTEEPPELPRMAERPLDREGADMLLRPTLRPLLRGAAERMPLDPRDTERPPEERPPLPFTCASAASARAKSAVMTVIRA